MYCREPIEYKENNSNTTYFKIRRKCGETVFNTYLARKSIVNAKIKIGKCKYNVLVKAVVSHISQPHVIPMAMN